MPYLLRVEDGNAGPEACVYETYDAYAFPPQISDHDLYLFNEGRLRQAYRTLGSHAEIGVSPAYFFRYGRLMPSASAW